MTIDLQEKTAMRRDNYPIEPLDERLISLFLEYLFLMLFVWGASIQIARIIGVPLITAGNISIFNMFISSFFWLKYVPLQFSINRQRLLSLLLLIVFGAIIGCFRSSLEIFGADAFHYLSRPAFLLQNPGLSLSFDMPGHFPENFSIIDGIWIPYTFEYFLGYISLLTGFSLIWLSMTVLPGIIASLIPFPLYIIFRKIGINSRSALVLVGLTIILLLSDSTSLTTFGGMSILRTFENKGILVGLGLPTFWYFLFDLQTLKKIKNYHYFRIFWIVSALSFLTANSIFLVPVSAILFFISMTVADHFIDGTIKYTKIQIGSCFLSIMATPFITWFLMQMFNKTNYSFVLSVHEILGRKAFSLSVMYGKVFENIGVSQIFLLCVGGILIFVTGFKNKNKILTGIGLWALGYILLVLNPISILIVKATSEMHMVYWRFFYVFPVFYLPAFALRASNYFTHKKLKMLVVCVIGFSICLFIPMHLDNAKNTIRKLDRGIRGETEFAYYYEQNLLGKGDLVLATRGLASMMVVVTPEIRQLVIHGYYLLGRAKNENEFENYLDLVKAQHFIDHRDSNFKNEFIRVVNKYSPNAIFARKSEKSKIDSILKNKGYKLIISEKGWSFFVKIQKYKPFNAI